MHYSNQCQESISTVQLSPFAEDQWSRIVTHSPIYLHWTDLATMSTKRTPKPRSAKRNLGSSVVKKDLQFDDDVLLDELHHMRRTVIGSRLKPGTSFNEGKFLEVEHDERTTSPTDEYQRYTDFFYQTREPPHLNQQQHHHHTKPQVTPTGPLKALSNIDFGPKPQASLGVQLRQSTITREHALASSIDHRVISPLTMCSLRRRVGSAHSGRRANPHSRLLHSQTPQTVDSGVVGGLYEQLSNDSMSTTRKSYPRSTNTSRSNMHMIKTKNDRARQKQHVELKTVLVQPSRPLISGDSDLEEKIPNSIELMRTFGGPVSAFERNLRYNYQRQLNQFRNGSTKV